VAASLAVAFAVAFAVAVKVALLAALLVMGNPEEANVVGLTGAAPAVQRVEIVEDGLEAIEVEHRGDLSEVRMAGS
jgi:hypothetical protein